MDKKRCEWVTDDEIYIKYHDEEWGTLKRLQDDNYLFEMITLEGAQAGLSWLTILKRRENYREAFDYFDPAIVARYGSEKREELLQNKGIIRNRLKIDSAINNAQVFLDVQAEYGNFYHFLSELVGGKQIVNKWESDEDVPASSELSERLSKELKEYGFTFVGPIICYSFLQAIGLINDHTKHCFLYENGKGEDKCLFF